VLVAVVIPGVKHHRRFLYGVIDPASAGGVTLASDSRSYPGGPDSPQKLSPERKGMAAPAAQSVAGRQRIFIVVLVLVLVCALFFFGFRTHYAYAFWTPKNYESSLARPR